MATALAVSVQSDDDLLVRAVARGDEHALTRLAEVHAGSVYGLLRMALPSKQDVEQALCGTFVEAAKRAGEPLSRADATRWLTGLAVEQISELSEPRPPIPLERTKNAGAGESAPQQPEENERLKMIALEAVNDRHLGVLVRTLAPRPRQALVLSVNCGLSDGQIASAMDCEVHEVRTLKDEAMAGLRARLVEHEEREEELRRQMSTGNAYHLRPIHIMPNGLAVVKGDKVYVDQAPSNLLTAIVKVMKKIIERIRHHNEIDAFDDDVGEVGHKRTPSPTATTRPFERPRLTPSLTEWRLPQSTRGIASYRAPKVTPSTTRLSSPRRPLRTAAATSWSSIRFGGRYGTR